MRRAGPRLGSLPAAASRGSPLVSGLLRLEAEVETGVHLSPLQIGDRAAQRQAPVRKPDLLVQEVVRLDEEAQLVSDRDAQQPIQVEVEVEVQDVVRPLGLVQVAVVLLVQLALVDVEQAERRACWAVEAVASPRVESTLSIVW